VDNNYAHDETQMAASTFETAPQMWMVGLLSVMEVQTLIGASASTGKF
jgi:hypothetical protein